MTEMKHSLLNQGLELLKLMQQLLLRLLEEMLWLTQARLLKRIQESQGLEL